MTDYEKNRFAATLSEIEGYENCCPDCRVPLSHIGDIFLRKLPAWWCKVCQAVRIIDNNEQIQRK